MSQFLLRSALVMCWVMVASSTPHLCGAEPLDEDEPRLDSKGHRLPPFAMARLGGVRMYTGGSISALACSPDGRYVASGTEGSGDVWLWDIDTQELVRIFHGGGYGIGSLDFSADGKLLAAGSAPGIFLTIWDVASGVMRHKIHTNAHASKVSMPVKFLRRRREVVSYDTGGIVQFWDQDFGSEIRRIPDGVERTGFMEDFYQSMDVSKDDRWLALASSDGRVRLYDLFGGDEPRVFGEGEVFVHGVRFIPGGPFLAWAASPRGHVNFDRESEKKLREQPGVGTFFQHRDEETPKLAFSFVPEWRQSLRSSPGFMAVSPDGQWIAVAPTHEVVQLWSTTGEQKEPRLLEAGGRALVFTPDSEILIVGSGFVQCFNVKTGVELYPQQNLELPGAASLAFTPDDQTILSLRRGPTVARWSPTTGELTSSTPYEFTDDVKERIYQGRDLRQIDPQGPFAELQDGAGMRLVMEATGTQESWFGLEPPLQHEDSQHPTSKILAISADGSTVVCRTNVRVLKVHERRSETSHTLRVIDLKAGKVRFELPIDYEMEAVALNRDGSRLAYARRREPEGATEPAGGYSIEEDLYLFDVDAVANSDAVSESDKHELWRTKDITVASTPIFTPDGNFIVTDPYYHHILQFIEAATGKVGFQLVGPHRSAGRGTVISPDGKRAVTITSDELVDVFDVQTGELTHRFRQPVRRVDLSHNGQRMLLVQPDLTVLVIDLSLGTSDLQADRKMATDENLLKAWLTMSPLDMPTGNTIDAFEVLVFGGERTVKLVRERVIDNPKLNVQDINAWMARLESKNDLQRCAMAQQLMPALTTSNELRLARQGPLNSQQVLAVRTHLSDATGNRLRDIVNVLYAIGSADAKQVVEQINVHPHSNREIRKVATEALKTWDISRSLSAWKERHK